MKKATPEKHPLPRASLVWTAHAFTRATDNASVCTCKLKDVDDASVLKGVAHILSLDVNETTKERHLLILLIPKPLSVSFLFCTSEKEYHSQAGSTNSS